jgi:hypothetical protein
MLNALQALLQLRQRHLKQQLEAMTEHHRALLHGLTEFHRKQQQLLHAHNMKLVAFLLCSLDFFSSSALSFCQFAVTLPSQVELKRRQFPGGPSDSGIVHREGEEEQQALLAQQNREKEQLREACEKEMADLKRQLLVRFPSNNLRARACLLSGSTCFSG